MTGNPAAPPPDNSAADAGMPRNPPAPPEPVKSARRVPYVHRLDTLAGCRAEAAALYRAARRGEVDSSVASRLASVLQLVARLLEAGDLETRLARLESQVADREPRRAA